MSYEKLGFVKGQKLKAEHLNHMEDGIANASKAVSDEEIIQMLMDIDIVNPISNSKNALYVNEKNKLYVL